jgi:hypothetical protein
MKKPRMIGGVAVEKIDILQHELDNNLPYWLSPVVRHADSKQARARRQKLYDQQWAKRQRASGKKKEFGFYLRPDGTVKIGRKKLGPGESFYDVPYEYLRKAKHGIVIIEGDMMRVRKT